MPNPLIATYIYLPGNFNEEELFRNYPVDNYKFRREFNRLELFYIMSRIIEVPYFNRSTRNNEGFIQLMAKYLQNAVPNYKNYLDYLVSAEVLQINKQYIAGKKTRGYTYREPYLSSPDLKEVPIKYTDRLYKLMASREREFSISESAQKSFPYLTKWLNNKLTIKFGRANELIALIHRLGELEKEIVKKATLKLLYESVIAYQPKELTRKQREEFHKAIRPVYEYRLGLMTIRWQRWFANVDSTVNRFHTNLTNMKSELRTCLRYDGKELVCVDISNCQPYILLLLLNPGFYTDNATDNNYLKVSNKASPLSLSILQTLITNLPPPQPNNITIQSFPSILNNIPSNPPTMVLESEKLTKIKDKEGVIASLTDYIKHSIKGTLYEYISDRLKKLGIQIPLERKDIKVMIFEILFTSNKYHSSRKKAFASIFPFVDLVIKAVKTEHHRFLPILLQQIESRIFLDNIARRISTEKPALPIYTVHDSIITLNGEEDYVQRIIEEECKKIIGIAPTVEITRYTDQGIATVKDQLLYKIEKINQGL